MIRFFKDHSKIICRLLLYQFGAAFLGITVSFVTSESNTAIDLLGSLFAIIFISRLSTWSCGKRELKRK